MITASFASGEGLAASGSVMAGSLRFSGSAFARERLAAGGSPWTRGASSVSGAVATLARATLAVGASDARAFT